MGGTAVVPKQHRRAALFQVGLVFAITTMVVAYRLPHAILSGPGWDTYAFLCNAAEFAQSGFGYSELHRPPFLSLLTALAFSLGAPMHESVIQWIDGALSISGVVALYLLVRRRTDSKIAIAVVPMVLSVTPLWEYLGSGYTDFPSVAIGLWMLLALIRAADDDPRYYLIAAALYVIAVMTRYTAILVAIPAFAWLMLRWRPFVQARMLTHAIGVAVVTYLPAGLFYASRFGDSLFPFAIAFQVAESVSAPGVGEPAAANAVWYAENVTRFLGHDSVTLIPVLVLLGGAVGLLTSVSTYFRRSPLRIAPLMIAVLGVTSAVLAQVLDAGLIPRQVSIVIAVIAVWSQLGPRAEDGRVSSAGALDATLLTWLLCYLDFHGHQNIQVSRYFIMMAPTIIFLTILGWHRGIHNLTGESGRILGSLGERSSRALGTATTVLLVSVSCISLAVVMQRIPESPNPYVAASRSTAESLLASGANEGSVIYSDLWPMTAWDGRLPARAMPFFRDPDAFRHQLDKSAADYYVTLKGQDFAGFSEIRRVEVEGVDTVRVLKRTQDSAPSRPRILYLGVGWERYLEELTEYRYYLDFDMGRYGWEGTAFIDDPTLTELQEYDVVALFGVKWRDRARGEQILREYVEDGGTLILDASGNLGDLSYQIRDTAIFGMTVRREALAREARVRILPSLAVEDSATLGASIQFVDEAGGAWYGAAYEPLPSSYSPEVLATADGKPLVSMLTVGEGRVYFIGYNLVWHAAVNQDPFQQELVQAVFSHALESR
ncbi:MAG: glycosyltransferase family 39 protein [Clostridiales bacterium]|nr:glycosyltransferase family 39 protein [Clostridiales bacterium]